MRSVTAGTVCTGTVCRRTAFRLRRFPESDLEPDRTETLTGVGGAAWPVGGRAALLLRPGRPERLTAMVSTKGAPSVEDGLFDRMSDEQLAAIRARLDEPPPVIALAGRNQGLTPIAAYLTLLREDRLQLVDEIDRLRLEMAGGDCGGDTLADSGRPEGEA